MKFIRNSRYQHYTEAMWEIENNPDVLALDKDPKAEEFLCDIYETENPNLKVPKFSDADPPVEKAADVENPEIHDVEGIMNLEECEWNEIFTIEEQEIKNHASVPGDNVTNTGTSADRNLASRESKITKNKILISQSPASSSPMYSRQLYLAALNSNCRVVVEKISIDSINYIIEKFSSDRPKLESSITTKTTMKRNHENVVENKTKKAKNSIESEKIDKKSLYLIEQRRLFNLTKTPMSTINKNSVSRIIDAITIDSDDNQSCIIVNPTKTKPDNLDSAKIPVKSKSKLLKSVKSSIETPDKIGDKTQGSTITINRPMSKIKHVKIKIDKKKDKKDWVDKNLKETPVTYENFFNNKKLSILGSGFKISKKPTAVTNEKSEIDLADEQWSDIKKPVDDTGNVSCAFDNNNDDDDDDCLWPKEKDQYDDSQQAPKINNIDDSNDFNWPKEKVQESPDRDRLPQPVSNTHSNDDGGGDDDDDYEWPKEKQGYDEYGEDTAELVESASDAKAFKVETKDTSPTVANDIDCVENESNQKWYGGGDGDTDEEATRISKSKDPWSKIISKSIKPEFLDDFCESRANDVIEIDDENEYGQSLKNNVKNESYNAPPKKSYGNVWSRIQEFQNQFESGETVASFSAEDMVLDSVDETLKNMNYIKDAKWLNSKNEDFLDSYTENIDNCHMKQHGKWYDVDDDDDIGPTHRQSPSQVIGLMDIDLNRKKSVDFISIDPFPGPVAESWVDSAPFKTYKSSFNTTSVNNNVSSNNSRSHSRPSNKTSRANFVSPNSKLPSFQNMTLEQLFPPFKKEYFKNTTNNFEKSPEQSPNWHDATASSNHLMKSQYGHMPSAYFNGPLAGGSTARDGTKYSRTKLNPRGPPLPCYDVNGSSINYNKDAPTNGFSAAGDSYSMYGSRFSKIGSGYPFYSARTGMVPVTPDSPDQHIDPGHHDQQGLDKSKLLSSKFGPVAGKTNGNFGGPAHRPYNYPTDGSQCTQSSYQDMNAAYFYPYVAPPFTQPYGNPNQYYPFFSPFGPVSFTPDSPDPEEMCPQEPPNQIG